MSFPSFVGARMFPVTPHDTNMLQDPQDTTAVLHGCVIECIGTAGNVVVVDMAGKTRTYPIRQYQTIPCLVNQVLSAGTTATTLWAYARR